MKYNPDAARKLEAEVASRQDRERRERKADSIENGAERFLAKLMMLGSKIDRHISTMFDFVVPLEEVITSSELRRRLESEVMLAQEEATVIEARYSGLRSRAQAAQRTLEELESDKEATTVLAKVTDALTALNELRDFEQQHVHPLEEKPN